MKKLELNERLIDQKVNEILNDIEGIKIPEVMAILGGAIFRMIDHVENEVSGSGELMIEWLERLAEEAKTIGVDENIKKWIIYQIEIGDERGA